jgi:hypothetical protein
MKPCNALDPGSESKMKPVNWPRLLSPMAKTTSNDTHDFPHWLVLRSCNCPSRSKGAGPALQGLRRASMPHRSFRSRRPASEHDGRRRREPRTVPRRRTHRSLRRPWRTLATQSLASPRESIYTRACKWGSQARAILPPCVMNIVQWIARVCSASHEAMAAARRFRSPRGPLNAVRSCSEFRAAFFEDRRVEPRGWVIGVDGEADSSSWWAARLTLPTPPPRPSW